MEFGVEISYSKRNQSKKSRTLKSTNAVFILFPVLKWKCSKFIYVEFVSIIFLETMFDFQNNRDNTLAGP